VSVEQIQDMDTRPDIPLPALENIDKARIVQELDPAVEITPAPAPVHQEVAEEQAPADAQMPVTSQPAVEITPAPAPVHQEVAEEHVPADAQMPVTSQPSSEMPPPSLPSPSEALNHIPSVNLLPPTPNTSQEASNYTAITLLAVPVPSQPAAHSGNTRSRSPTPVTELRRSQRLASPSPGSSNKRQASDPLDEPAAKKMKD
jgi:hypothetical protein